MRLIRYLDHSGRIQYAAEQPGGARLRMEGDPFGKNRVTQESAEIAKILAPVVPVMIWCIGQNYRRHADEVGMSSGDYPVVFAKGTNSLQDPGGSIAIPTRAGTAELDYEGELVVIIGKACKDVTRERALKHVAGYTCGNDVSARDWQIKWGGSQWCRGKSFDTFAPLGPCLELKDEIPDPATLKIKTILNGEVLQDWRTDDMIFDVPTLIAFLSGSTTLLPGTVILTGTPHGVGFVRKPPVFLKPGDTVTIDIDRIGALINPVIAEAE